MVSTCFHYRQPTTPSGLMGYNHYIDIHIYIYIYVYIYIYTRVPCFPLVLRLVLQARAQEELAQETRWTHVAARSNLCLLFGCYLGRSGGLFWGRVGRAVFSEGLALEIIQQSRGRQVCKAKKERSQPQVRRPPPNSIPPIPQSQDPRQTRRSILKPSQPPFQTQKPLRAW